MTTVQRILMPPTYMRPGETQDWPIALAFPSRVMGVENLPAGVEILRMEVGLVSFEGETLEGAKDHVYLPGEGRVLLVFRNSSDQIVQRRGVLLLAPVGIGTASTPPPAPPSDLGTMRSPASSSGGSDEELVLPLGFTPEGGRSNSLSVRLSPGQASVILRLLRGQTVAPSERESVRIAFERSQKP